MAIELYECAEKMMLYRKAFDKDDLKLKCNDYAKLTSFGKMIMKNEVTKEMLSFWEAKVETWKDSGSYIEEEEIKLFRHVYGFMPDNIEEKTKYINMFFERDEGCFPENDKERDEYTEGLCLSNLLKMEWKKRY